METPEHKTEHPRIRVTGDRKRTPIHPLPENVTQFLRRRSENRHRRRLNSGPLIKIVALVGAVVLVGGMAYDLSTQSRREGAIPRIPSDDNPAALMLGIHDRVYQDPENRFRIRTPEPWAVYTGVNAKPYQVRFYGPRDLEVSVLVAPAPGMTFDDLQARIRAQQKEWDVETHIRVVSDGPRPMVERTVQLLTQQVRTLDFIVHDQWHQLQVSAPVARFDESLPLLTEILATYETGPFPDPTKSE